MSEIECRYKYQDIEKFNGEKYCLCFNDLCKNLSFACDKNCQIFEDYKQLQELKAENELLKNERTIDLRNQLEQLKAENEELQKQVQFKNQFRDYAHKYKATLDEIEEIILKRQKEHYCYCDECSPFKEILQKIKEVKQNATE